VNCVNDNGNGMRGKRRGGGLIFEGGVLAGHYGIYPLTYLKMFLHQSSGKKKEDTMVD